MREVIIISGKGGAGKTSITAAFAHLAKNAVLCDCDVDTPDLHILLQPEIQQQHQFYSGHIASINQDLCISCGDCMERCRFDAVSYHKGGYQITPWDCEGCKVCVNFCPQDAIDFVPRNCGDWFVSTTRFGTLVHAQLHPGEENSGLLVSRLKQEALAQARKLSADLILSDGSPGIGCPVISSLRGAHLAVIVTEPTPSGRHDCLRVAQLCEHFQIPVGILINKADINPVERTAIHNLCKERGYTHIADLPYDQAVTHAMLQRKAVTELDQTALFSTLQSAAY